MVRRRYLGGALAIGCIALSAGVALADGPLGIAEPARAERPGSGAGACAAATPFDPGFIARIEDHPEDPGFVVIAEDRSNDAGFFPFTPCAPDGR